MGKFSRLLFEKTGDAVYISHLDLMRIFQRAFRRADIMIWHSRGFSPRAYVSIALPLSVGASSVCEILDFEIEDGEASVQGLAEKLNAVLPAGIRVLQAYESDRKRKELTRLHATVTLEYDDGVPVDAQKQLGALFGGESLIIHKKTKRGEADLDLRPMIYAMAIHKVSNCELLLDAVVQAQSPGMNPQLLVTAIETHRPGLKPDFSVIHRVDVLDENGTSFR